MTPIEIADVEKTYGPATALDGVSIDFEPGAIHALVGPNGSGKTTLFRVLLGLTRPDAGTVSVPEATIGCSFQNPQFYEGLTVRENLGLFAELTDAPPDWVESLVDRLGLARVSHRRAGALSAGVGKRLDLALALVDRPDALLLDEPLADVDEEHRSRLREFLSAYASDERVLVLATHRFDAFESLLDTVTVIDAGRVVAGPADVDAIQGGLREFYTEARDATSSVVDPDGS